MLCMLSIRYTLIVLSIPVYIVDTQATGYLKVNTNTCVSEWSLRRSVKPSFSILMANSSRLHQECLVS